MNESKLSGVQDGISPHYEFGFPSVSPAGSMNVHDEVNAVENSAVSAPSFATLLKEELPEIDEIKEESTNEILVSTSYSDAIHRLVATEIGKEEVEEAIDESNYFPRDAVSGIVKNKGLELDSLLYIKKEVS